MGVITTPPQYLTVEDADEYFLTRLNSEVWNNATDDEKNKALIKATQAIDALAFEGIKTGDYENLKTHGAAPIVQQALEWPRNGDSVIPQDIYIACCECAIAFLDGVDIGEESDLIGAVSMRFADVSTTYMAGFFNEWVRAGIPSAEAWAHLKPYLHDPMQIRSKRA